MGVRFERREKKREDNLIIRTNIRGLPKGKGPTLSGPDP
jgi:hypothetical protein